jgi:two-component system NtrC family sensor kinase
MAVIFTNRDKCRSCYACVRTCPAHAIKVQEGLAEVIKENCISCGNCIKVCSQGAKRLESDTGNVWILLGQQPAPIAILGASFPAAFPGVRPGQVVAALKRLGFGEVVEVAFGGELVAREYKRLLSEGAAMPLISSNCPAVVTYIEKYYPELLDNLAPVVSSITAMGRVIKDSYRPGSKVVFIGPCVAARAEREDPRVAGAIDAVITFGELEELFAQKDIVAEMQEDMPTTGPRPNRARMGSFPGSYAMTAGISGDPARNDIVVAEGFQRVREVIADLAKKEIKPTFVELYMCESCAEGPVMQRDVSLLKKKQLILEYARSEADPAQTEADIARYGRVNLKRKYTNQYVNLPYPSEEEIRGILSLTDKKRPDDELNCGACGYRTCREKAVAVYRGLAESDMCWPFLVKRLKATQEQLIQAEKLTSLGQMAGAIAHELNNPLAGVLVYTKLISKKISGDNFSKEEAVSQLAKIEAEVNRSSRIIRNLLDFARQSEPMSRLLDINDVLEQSLALVGHQAQMQKVEVVREFSPVGLMVLADFDQLRQVFTNLILNGIQAMPGGGKLTLRTSVVTEDDIGGKKKDWVKVDVSDTGVGIPKENMRKLFTPFFTTKERGKGVGLGLAVVHGIIERHKGRIKVDSEVGKGTTFSIYLELRRESAR